MYDEGYYRSRESTRDFLIEAALLYEMLRPPSDSRILEVGCGGGGFLAYLESKGHRPFGVDLLQEAVEAARSLAANSEILQADAYSLPFEDESFDCLVSQHLIEHLEDLPRALAEWRRVLRPGGNLAICTPNSRYPCPSLFYDPSHVHIYALEELKRAVCSAGFAIREGRTVFPHLWKGKISVKAGVPLYWLFEPLPLFRERGRTLLLAASKTGAGARRKAEPGRLLIVNHAVEMGGAEKVLVRFLDSLDRTVFEPALACPNEGPLVDEMRARDIPVHLGFPSERLLDIKRQSLGGNRLNVLAYPYDLIKTVIRLRGLIRREDYDLILTNSAKADIYGSIAGRLAGRPVVWRLHDIVTSQAFNRLNMILFRLAARFFATRILGVSAAVRQALIALGVDEDKVRVVYNGVETREAPADDRKRIRKELGIPVNAPVAGLVGRLVDWKGPDRFLEAAAMVKKEIEQARFLLVGDAIFGEKAYAEGLQELAASLGIADSVVFTGFRQDVPDIMASLDVLVHASILPDPLPTVLIEAMSMGLPVIASDGGGVPEIVEDQVTGLLVPPGDARALAAAMTRMLSDGKEAKRMGDSGRERAAELFDLERTALEMQERLLECLEETG